MNDPLDYVEQLAECARRETPPCGHVLPAALARLQFMTPPPPMRPWSVFATGAITLAVIAAISLAFDYGNASQDPILAMFKVASINL